MHGLINRSIQRFLVDSYGCNLWRAVAEVAEIEPDGFEAMLIYDDDVTFAVLNAATDRLGQPIEALLEDLGTYLVSHPHLERLRRLLRFGGVSFVDFLHSIDDLPGRGRLAVPELDLPQFELRETGNGRFTILCRAPHFGFCHVMVGVVRAMADDYGALVVLDRVNVDEGLSRIDVHLLDQRHAEGRQFDLSRTPS